MCSFLLYHVPFLSSSPALVSAFVLERIRPSATRTNHRHNIRRNNENSLVLPSTVVPSSDQSPLSAPPQLDNGGDVEVDPSNLPSIARHIFHHTRNLDDLYDKSSKLRCPFLRRRAADAIDGMAMVLRFLVIRHKSLGIFDPLKTLPFLDDDGVDGGSSSGGRRGSSGEQLLQSTVRPPGWKAVGKHVRKNADGTVCKNRNLPLFTIAQTIERDWLCGPQQAKGYYLTGRLNSTIYRDDCLFNGPDPDMPVKGLRKYLSAVSHLFERESSFAQLLDLRAEEGGGRLGRGAVVVRWRLGGTLMLPWRPAVWPWTKTTTYHLDEEGLVYLHEEEWDVTVLEAFVCTVFPKLGERMWPRAAAADTATSVQLERNE